MADSVELPNVDIFDPVMCAKRWAQCATQQEINVYLNKQIDRNREVLTATIKAQNEINAASKTKLADHDSRIAALESGLAALNKAQSDLNASFVALVTDNNNFKANVDLLLNQYQTTINLLQDNIDKISVSNEQLWNEVNKLKSQFDPDKLDAAIAGYTSVVADANKYTDAQIAALSKTVTANQTAAEQWRRDHDINFQSYQLAISERFNEQQLFLNNELATMRGGITLFRNQVDEVLNQMRDNLVSEVARLDAADKKQSDLHAADERNNEAAHQQLNALIQEVATNAQANLDAVTSQLNGVDADIKADILARDKAINARVDSVQAEIDKLKISGGKQWDTINAILEAQNRINEQMAELDAYIKQEIANVTQSLGLVANRVGNLESDSAEKGTQINALALRCEYLEETTGWKYRATVRADGSGTKTFKADFGSITFNCTASQVSFLFTPAAGITGMLSIPANDYGRMLPIPIGNNNVIQSSTAANFITGFIVGYADTKSPVPVMIYYNPASGNVHFLLGFERNASVQPQPGNPLTAS